MISALSQFFYLLLTGKNLTFGQYPLRDLGQYLDSVFSFFRWLVFPFTPEGTSSLLDTGLGNNSFYDYYTSNIGSFEYFFAGVSVLLAFFVCISFALALWKLVKHLITLGYVK